MPHPAARRTGAGAAGADPLPCNDVAALRAAITKANTSGGSVVLAPRCVYNLSQPDNPDDGLPEITGKVRISGDGTYIQRGTGSSSPYRIFHVKQGGSLSVESVTVRGGQTTADSGHGGGFFNDRGSLTLKNVTVSNNQGSVGGGIWNQLGTLVLKDSTVRDNRGGFGAGVATNGTMRMSGGAIRDNMGQIWGGGLANAGDTKLDRVSVDGNTSSDHGGGIANPGTRFGLFIGTNGAVKQNKSGAESKKQPTPFEVNLIRSTVFKNSPTNCAPPDSVPGCEAVGSAPAKNTTKPGRS